MAVIRRASLMTLIAVGIAFPSTMFLVASRAQEAGVGARAIAEPVPESEPRPPAPRHDAGVDHSDAGAETGGAMSRTDAGVGVEPTSPLDQTEPPNRSADPSRLETGGDPVAPPVQPGSAQPPQQPSGSPHPPELSPAPEGAGPPAPRRDAHIPSYSHSQRSGTAEPSTGSSTGSSNGSSNGSSTGSSAGLAAEPSTSHSPADRPSAGHRGALPTLNPLFNNDDSGDSGSGPEIAMLVALLLFAAAMAVATRRVSHRLTRRGLLPRIVRTLDASLRVGVFLLVLGIGRRIAGDSPAYGWFLVAACVAAGWSARNALQDLAARVVLAFEPGIQPGTWVACDEFSGTIERIGLRATWLEDRHGHHVMVPNQKLVNTAMVADETTDGLIEVVVALDHVGLDHVGLDSAPLDSAPLDSAPLDSAALDKTPVANESASRSNARALLGDAVLSSPWIFPGSQPLVLRDPTKPNTWKVRCRLLEPRFALQFEGDLVERVEELAHALPCVSG